MNPVPGIKSKGRLGEDWAREGRNLFVSIGTTQSPDGVNLFPLQMAWWGEDFCSGVDPQRFDTCKRVGPRRNQEWC